MRMLAPLLRGEEEGTVHGCGRQGVRTSCPRCYIRRRPPPPPLQVRGITPRALMRKRL